MSVKTDYHKRTLLKTITFRIIATTTTMLIFYIFTDNVALSVGVGILENIVKMVFYYFHERIWNKISYGKSKHPLSDIILKKEITPEDKKVIKMKLEELGFI